MVNEQSNKNQGCCRNDGIDNKSRVFITSPIYYVNGEPHLGHLYTSIAVDILAKFQKITLGRVFTSFGTDEHGQKVESASEGDPQAYVDKMHLSFKNLLDLLDIKPNYFVRTSSNVHKEVAKHFWTKIYDAGYIYEGVYEGWYSKRDEAYYKEDEVKDGIAISSGSPVEWMKEPCFFFALSKFKDKLFVYYSQNPEAIKPKSKYLEVMAMLRSDVPDLAVSRSRFTWGIPVPKRSEHVMYVWIDALVNYLTVLGYPKNENWEFWWERVIHIIGKDILRFHAIYWPAFLMAADINPPSRIFAHGWWQVEGQKMSKSLGNVVDPFAIVKKYGKDQIRYFLFREVNFGNDGSFAEYAVKHIINTELVNELGNLVQRVLKMAFVKFGATIECCNLNAPILIEWTNAFNSAKDKMDSQDITKYLNDLREVICKTNQYVDQAKPWSVSDPKEIIGILCLCLQRLAIMSYPIIPEAASKLAHTLGLSQISINQWDANNSVPIPEPKGLFARWEA